MLHELGADGNGSRIAVFIGDTVTIRLPERRTAGFRWQPVVDPAALELVKDRYEPPGDLPGAPGTHLFTFEVHRAGPTRVRLVSRRSWGSQAGGEEYIADISATLGPEE